MSDGGCAPTLYDSPAQMERGARPVRPTRTRTLYLAVCVGLLAAVAACSTDDPQSSLNTKSDIARQIDDLFWLTVAVAIVILVLVAGALFYAMIRFRRRRDDEGPEPKQIHGNTRLEVVWTIIPAVILAALAVPTVRTLFDIREPATGPDVVNVKVTGHQWWWEFEYPDFVNADGRALITANELHIPAGGTVQLVMTSADVIHSFWVPPLAGKRDVVPGRFTELRLESDAGIAGQVIPGQCAEFCGLAHADMRMRVFVDSAADFDAWVEDQLAPVDVPADGPAAAGWETFNQVCSACHQAYVRQTDGAVVAVGQALGPDLTHFGGRSTMAAAILQNEPHNLAQWIDNPSSLKPMAPQFNDLTEFPPRILGMPDYGLEASTIAELVALLEGWA